MSVSDPCRRFAYQQKGNRIDDMAFLYKTGIILFYITLFIPVAYHWGRFSIPLWACPIAGLFLLDIIERLVRSDGKIQRWDIFDWAVTVFVVLMISTSLLHPPVEDLGYNKLSIYMMAMMLGVYIKHNWGRLFVINHLINFAFVFIAVQFIIAVVQFVTGTPFGNLSAYVGADQIERLKGGQLYNLLGIGRSEGTVGAPNLLGRAVVVITPFVILQNWMSSRRYRSFVTYLQVRLWILMVSVILLLTFSRSSVLVFVFLGGGGWLIYRAFSINSTFLTGLNSSRLSASYVIVLISTIVGVFGMSQKSIRTSASRAANGFAYRIQTATGLGETTASVGLDRRAELNWQAIQMFIEQPLLGHGYFNTKRIPQRSNHPLVAQTDLRVHNAFLQYFAEGGIFVGLAFIVIVLYPVYVTWKSRKGDPTAWALFAACIAIAIFMQSSTTYDSLGLSSIYALIWGAALGYCD